MTLDYDLGLNDHSFEWTNASSWPVLLDAMAAMGCKWVRMDLALVQVSGTNYPYVVGGAGTAARVAAFAAAAKTAGLNVLFALIYPSLATSQADTLASELAALVSAPGCQGLAWEIGNEPEYGGIDPVVYAEVVNVVYPAMKAADPTCRVGVGVVANVNMGGKGQSWLAKAFAAGFVGDFLSYHSYDGWSGVASPDVPPAQWWGGNGVLAICQQFENWAIGQGWHGDFWITETGIQSTDPSGGMTLALQAQWMGELLPLYEQLSPVPKVVCVYELSDEGQGSDIDWGMMTGEGIGPKPVYAVVQALAAPAPPPVPTPPPPPPAPETADQYAAAHGMVVIDVAEARQAIHVGISYYTWSNGAMHGSRLPSIPTGITLYAFAAPLDAHHIHHAGP